MQTRDKVRHKFGLRTVNPSLLLECLEITKGNDQKLVQGIGVGIRVAKVSILHQKHPRYGSCINLWINPVLSSNM